MLDQCHNCTVEYRPKTTKSNESSHNLPAYGIPQSSQLRFLDPKLPSLDPKLRSLDSHLPSLDLKKLQLFFLLYRQLR